MPLTIPDHHDYNLFVTLPKMSKAWACKLYKEKLKDPGKISLEKKRIRGEGRNWRAGFKYLKGCHKVQRESLPPSATEGRRRGNQFQLQQNRFKKKNLRKKSLMVRAGKQ